MGFTLIHEGISGAVLNKDNSMMLTWGVDSTIRVWKNQQDTNAFYSLPPRLIKLRAQIETGVEVSSTDNSIKVTGTREYVVRKRDYLQLLEEYKKTKK